jgi:uncharacterized protein YndB with AHSA1/START domain
MTNTKPVTRTITLSRVYDAPRETVFAMWTQAEHIAQWWGPDDCTAPHVESDPRPGGRLVITMQGPGFTHTMEAVYREIDPPSGFAIDCVVNDPEDTRFLETSHRVRFEDVDGRTRVTVEATASALRDEALAALDGMLAGWNQSLQCLDDALKGTLDRQIVLTRLYAAPPEKVFPMWRDGADHPHSITYDEIVPSQRLVYSVGDGGVPYTSIVTFDEVAGQTALSMRAIFESAAVRDRYIREHGGIEGGTQTMARVAELLGESTQH